LLLLVALLGTARASQLGVTATAVVADRTSLTVQARNTGDAAVSEVVPVVVYQGHETRGDDVAALAPGAGSEWTFTLPPPSEPGTVPAVVHVHFVDTDGRHAVPAVASVSTPGLLGASDVRASLAVSAAGGFEQAVLILENPAEEAAHGRVVAVLPGGIETEPASQAAEVPAHGSRTVSLVLQNRGGAPRTAVPMFALFEYGREGRRQLAVASAMVPAAGGGPGRTPLVVGAAALATALALLGLAWWRAAESSQAPKRKA
jgi:hypothetical protein